MKKRGNSEMGRIIIIWGFCFLLSYNTTYSQDNPKEDPKEKTEIKSQESETPADGEKKPEDNQNEISEKKSKESDDQKNIIKILHPKENQEIKRGGVIQIIWKVNDNLGNDESYVLEFSTNYGAKWIEIEQDKSNFSIGKESFEWNLKDVKETEIALVRIALIKDNNKVEVARSDKFIIVGKLPDEYKLSLGFNFSFINKVKVDGIYSGIELPIKDIFRNTEKNKSIGINFFLAQGSNSTKSEDNTSTTKISDTSTTISNETNSEFENFYLSAELFYPISEKIQLNLIHYDFRRQNEKRTYQSNIKKSLNNNEFLNQDSLDVSNKTTYESFIGTGFKIDYNINNIDVYISINFGYNANAKEIYEGRDNFISQLDYITRFFIRENTTEIKVGGELRGPLGLGENGNASPELLFYISRDVSLSGIYNELFN